MNSISMQDVVELCVQQGKIDIIATHGNQIQTTCPNCGDRRGKFYINLQKNGFYCHHCGDFKGNMVGLFSACFDKTYTDDSAGFVNFIKDYNAIYNGADAEIDKLNQKRIDLSNVNVEEIERVSDEYCSRVYYSMLSMLELRKEHYEDLKRRGLSDEDIKRFKFKSTPKDPKGIVKKLLSMGYDLEGVPGFYVENKEWNLAINDYKQGYLCPCFDGEKNLIVGFQIRLDSPQKGQKYVWLSSSNREKGVSSGALSTCLPGKNSETIIITEGILKSLIIYCLLNKEITVIGVPGVNALKGLKPYLERYSNSVYAYIAYDMDAQTNDKVEKAKNQLKELTQKYDIDNHSLSWNTDANGVWKGQYKGLDDFLVEYEEKYKFTSYLTKKSHESMELKKFLASS